MTTVFVDLSDPLNPTVRNRYDERVRQVMRDQGARWDGGLWSVPADRIAAVMVELRSQGHNVVVNHGKTNPPRGNQDWTGTRRQEPGWSEQAQRAADEATRRARQQQEQARRARERAQDFFRESFREHQQRNPPPRPPRGGSRTWADDLLAEAGADAGKLYKTLLRVLHPDTSGFDSTRLMQHLNAARDRSK